MTAKKRDYSAPLQPCGTPAAYRRHGYYGEPRDADCKAAWAKDNRERAARRRARNE